MKHLIILLFILGLLSCSENDDTFSEETVTDTDGNVYKTVKIGDHIWMAENLKTTKYNDGTPIANVTNTSTWSNLSSGAYCWYDNNATYQYKYGALYNWFSVNTGKLAPKGWHVPSKVEFESLYKDGITSVNVFNSILGGGRGVPVASGKPVYSFENIEIVGYWWTSTKSEYSPLGAYYSQIVHYERSLGTSYGYPQPGYSVRCVKD